MVTTMGQGIVPALHHRRSHPAGFQRRNPAKASHDPQMRQAMGVSLIALTLLMAGGIAGAFLVLCPTPDMFGGGCNLKSSFWPLGTLAICIAEVIQIASQKQGNSMLKHTFFLVPLALLATAQPAAADTVSDWVEFANRVNSPLAPPPESRARPDSGRATTRVALAMFEALNAIDRRYESYVGMAQGDKTASPDAAAITAAYRVLSDHFPSAKADLNDAYAIAMQAIPNDANREAGRLIGEQAAKAALAVGGIDPNIVQIPYKPKTTPGVWTATDLPSTRPNSVAFYPWAIPNADSFRSPPPPAMTSERWAKDYDEVKRLGGKRSAERTPHQSLMAEYRIMPDISPSLRRTADSAGRTLVQNARMYARVYMAIDDSTMAMSAAKLYYDSWRPITAIRNGAADGNDATVPDPAWESFLPTPNFPEHPCGHCAYAGSVAVVMIAEDGLKPSGGVRVTSRASPKAVVQILPNWDEWVQQVSDSRIYAGAHFRFANEAGEAVGHATGKSVLDKVMRPLPQTKPR